ncbi:hypothetical protein DSECCO2_339790 [anaerobic digester metagenome]|jgi:hypothetical protein|uniref:hypothetical protein n=1 Tax=Petrimonas sp. TaxID=2023866 RepID=UPI0030D447A3
MKKNDLKISLLREDYEAPEIKIFDIEIEQNILGGSTTGTAGPEDMPTEPW